MKSIVKISLILVVVIVFYAFVSEKNKTTTGNEPGRIMAFRPLTLRENINPQELERFAREQLTPTFKNKVVGVESYIIKGQRGDHKGGVCSLVDFR